MPAGPRGDRDPESLAELFAPDIILPEQFFEGARRDSYISGEKALMLAVLEDGIRCFQEHLRNPRSNPRLLSQQPRRGSGPSTTSGRSRSTTSARRWASTRSALRSPSLDWKAKRLAEREERGKPTPTDKKVYRLHLRTKRTSGVR